ncbi:MAG: hypothetical protein AB1466_00470 [Actinomycetota bacterium]
MRKLGIICLALLVGLAFVGFGYAWWMKTLKVDGTVKTGHICASYTKAFTDDNAVVDDAAKDSQDDGKDPAASGPDPKPRQNKDVGSSSATIVSATSATVTISNGYPCYYTTAWYDIHNAGTIPLKIKEVRVNGVPVTPSVPTPFDLDGDGIDDVTIHVTNIAIGQIFDPSNTIQMDLDIHVEEGAPQAATMTFLVEVDFIQWNCP